MKCKCKRCGYSWVSRLTNKAPKNCPACKQPKWQVPKRSKK